MACCDPGKSCHCASQSESPAKPAPLAPAAPELKFAFIAPPATDDSAAPAVASFPPRVLTALGTGARAGYAGVPLSVAFCSFVI